jgi:hypothetical protein
MFIICGAFIAHKNDYSFEESLRLSGQQVKNIASNPPVSQETMEKLAKMHLSYIEDAATKHVNRVYDWWLSI